VAAFVGFGQCLIFDRQNDEIMDIKEQTTEGIGIEEIEIETETETEMTEDETIGVNMLPEIMLIETVIKNEIHIGIDSRSLIRTVKNRLIEIPRRVRLNN
jgi:hypothetical protein